MPIKSADKKVLEKDAIIKKQQKKILEYIKENGKITSHQAEELLKVKQRRARIVLVDMQEYLIATNARSDTRKLSKLELAKHMDLISQSEYGGYRAKNFAVLMFAEKPDKFIPEATVKVIREVVGTDKMEAKTFDGPIWIQAKQVSKYFQDNIMSSYTVRESDVIEH